MFYDTEKDFPPIANGIRQGLRYLERNSIQT